MSGLKLAALYGFYPHQLGLCGPSNNKDSKEKLSKFLRGERVPLFEIEKILKKFKGAFSYYQLIAKSNQIRDPFDRKVVQAYWIGNELLERVDVNELRDLIKRHLSRSKSSSLEEIIRIIPSDAKAHHTFHVLAVGSFNNKFSFTEKMINLCRVSWAEVVEIKDKSKAIVRLRPLKLEKAKFILGKKEILREVFWNPDFISELKLGQTVSLHWNHIIQILKEEEKSQLENYTYLIIKTLNKRKISPQP
jgi:hypothetical protein